MSDHIEVGAYALGLLNEPDTRAFEAHLADCASCQSELTEFSSMAELLTGVGPVEPPSNQADEPSSRAGEPSNQAGEPSNQAGGSVVTAPGVTDLLRRRAEVSRRRKRWATVAAVAACAAALGGGLAAGLTLGPASGSPSVATGVTGQRHSATDPGTGVTGTVGLVAKGWGTQVTLDLANVHGPLECELVAVSKAGERRVVNGWFVPVPGDGVPGHPAHLLVQGGTSIPLNDLSHFDVVVVNGPTLVSIPA